MNGYILLFFAIISEVFGSSMLKSTNGFKKLMPSLGVLFGYGVAFYLLSLSLKTLPLGIAYAIWSGLGTAFVAIVGLIIYKEKMNLKKFIGLVSIIAGVMLLNIEGK